MASLTERPARAAIQVGIGGFETLEVFEPFDRAWRRVGLALDRVGFTVEDRDRQKGVYFVRYADADRTKPKEKPGFLDRFACLRVLLLGHSHGAITADVIASRLEGEYSARIIQVVDVDRVETLYIGDVLSRPKQVRIFNIYEKNDAVLAGAPYDAPNVANWNASEEMAPRDGQDGGPLIKANHTTIDNSKSVRNAIVGEVMVLP